MGASYYKVSDSLRYAGIQKVVEAASLSASWQMCQVHCTRAVLRNIPKKHQKEVVEGLKEAYGSEQKFQDLADDLNLRGYRKPANTIERLIPSGAHELYGIPQRTRETDPNHQHDGTGQ